MWQGIRSALAQIDAEQETPLLKALCDFEQRIEHASLVERVNRHIRQPEQLKIIDWDPQFRNEFRQLNEQWLNHYFADQLEPCDISALHQPEQYFLSQGGYIWLAQISGKIVGCCGLRADGDNFELCKMGVHPDWQGQGIGRRLLLHVLTKLRNRNCPKIWLETHSKLERAMALYLHFGFQPETQSYDSLYQRSNIRLQLSLSETL